MNPVYAFLLAGLVVVAVTICAVLGVPVPELLTAIGLTAVGAGGGAMLPNTRFLVPSPRDQGDTSLPAASRPSPGDLSATIPSAVVTGDGSAGGAR